jgi:hypothetical protein
MMCNNGLHASETPLNALYYAPGSLVCRVRLHGERDKGFDKVCARYRTVLWMADAENLLRAFAADCAQDLLERERQAGREPDRALWAAVSASRLYSQGEIDLAEMVVAHNTTRISRPDGKDFSAWHAAHAARACCNRPPAATVVFDVVASADNYCAQGLANDQDRDVARGRAWRDLNHQLSWQLMTLAPQDWHLQSFTTTPIVV